MTYMQRVLDAVNDDVWQDFRRSMKGKSTEDKLCMLRKYWTTYHDGNTEHTVSPICPVCIQEDNYLKALCRGGQLYSGMSLQKALDDSWEVDVKR